MASNDPIASKSRKPALSVEEAERFASQIRPSWELLGPDGSAGAFGQDDAPGVAAPAAGSVSKASDTIIEGVPTVAVGGSEEPAPEDGWGDEEPKAATAIEEAEAPPIEAKPIASIGITEAPEVPVSGLPLPPEVGHPRVPTPGAPVAPSPPAKTKLGIGGTSGERAPMAKPKPTRSDATTTAPVSAKAAVAHAAGKTGASRSRTGATNPGVNDVPAESEAGDDIEIPISGAPKGLLLKIGGGVAAIAVILLAIKLFSGGSDKVEPVTTAPTATATAAAVTPPTPAPPEPPKATAATATAAAPTAAPTTAPTAAATTAPTAKEKPVVAKVEAPPPVVKKPAPTSGGSTPPAGGGKKGGGIIRETPF